MNYAVTAVRQVARLRTHYEQKDRFEALLTLQRALRYAEDMIAEKPHAGLPAPRPYPEAARLGTLWIYAKPYWVRYTPTEPRAILNVFFDEADIPGRIDEFADPPPA